MGDELAYNPRRRAVRPPALLGPVGVGASIVFAGRAYLAIDATPDGTVLTWRSGARAVA